MHGHFFDRVDLAMWASLGPLQSLAEPFASRFAPTMGEPCSRKGLVHKSRLFKNSLEHSLKATKSCVTAYSYARIRPLVRLGAAR